MIKLGEIVLQVPITFGPSRMMEGRVTLVNRRHRWYQVTFTVQPQSAMMEMVDGKVQRVVKYHPPLKLVECFKMT